jgi:hypothetical protein
MADTTPEDSDAPLADPDGGAAVPNDMPAQRDRHDDRAAQRPQRDGPARAEPRPPPREDDDRG